MSWRGTKPSQILAVATFPCTGFIVGTIKAAIVPGSTALFNFLKERLGNKPIEMTIKAPDGRELRIKADSEAKFDFVFQKAQEFLNS